MEPGDPSSISFIFLAFLFLLSAFFSGSEVALVSLSAAKVRSMVQQKKRGSHAVSFLKNHPDRLLVTILLGNNVVNILIPVISTVVFTELFGSQILGIMTGILTLLLLVFGEIVPKAFAQKHDETISLLVGPAIYYLGIALFPIVWLFERLLRLLGTHGKEEKTFSDEELIALAEIGEEEGGLDAEDRERIENVLEFGDTVVSEVMTPRPDMDTLHDETTLKDAVRFFLEKTHSRIPVYGENIDHIHSILTLKNVLKFEQDFLEHTPIKNLPKNEPLTVPTTMPLEDVLKEMKWRRTHIAIVIDEYGGTAGLVTLEDLLEEVFGEIEDETDTKKNEFKKMPDGSWLVSGGADIEAIEEKTGIRIPGEDNDRLAKIILEEHERFPNRGEEVVLRNNVRVVVEKMHHKKIASVRIFPSQNENSEK